MGFKHRQRSGRHHSSRRGRLFAHQNKLHRIWWVEDYKRSHPCVDCGETDIRQLTFDHRNPVEKQHDIGWLLRYGGTQIALMKEIAKCDVRCRHCHDIRHSVGLCVPNERGDHATIQTHNR